VTDVAVTAWSLHVPGTCPAAVVPGLAGPGSEVEACSPDRAHELLGRKGLLNKDAATRLALCAVHSALGLRPGQGRAVGPPDPSVAVVASSNLGNVGAVTDVVAMVRDGRRKQISPLAAPGVSGNVLSSAVAIWFGFGGPALMICSGAASGLDAVTAGTRLVRAGRAARVVVVGAEPADEVAAALHGLREPVRDARPPLRQGSACVILEPAGQAPAAPLLTPVPGDPGESAGETAAMDLTAAVGDLYGALGVAQTAVAAAVVGARAGVDRVRLICRDAPDGWRAVDVTARVSGR